MYEKLIKRLREAPNDGPDADLHYEAADAIEELMRRCEQLAWTPVTEGLPVERINPYTRDFEFVLCRTIWGDVRPFKYGTQIGQKKAHFWNGAGYVDAYVTHWMQLPTPPKEVT